METVTNCNKLAQESCAKVWADTLHNNQFAPLADNEDKDDNDSDLALPVLNHATG